MFTRRIAVFTTILATFITALPLLAGPEALELEGRVTRTTIGGVETPSRTAYAIGARRFVVSGPMAAALDASVEQRLTVRGLAYAQMAIGAEALPRLEVFELRLTSYDLDQNSVRLLGTVKVQKGLAEVDGMTFSPEGPLAQALLALTGLEVELTGVKPLAATPSARPSVFITSIGRRDLTKVATAQLAPAIMDRVIQDAIGRYSRIYPGTPAGVFDGAGPALKTAELDKSTGQYRVVVETFGGIIGGSMGNEQLYLYDAQGKLVEEQTL
jgi:hypothetical protein